MKLKLNFVIILTGLLSANYAYSQHRISGEITDKSGQPVPGTWISFNDGQMQFVSDINGQYSFSYSDTVKTRKLQFQAVGFKIRTMVFSKNQEILNVVLLDSTMALGAVTVSASKQGRFSDYSAQTTRMSSFDIVTNPAAMADLIGNMRVLPGVQTNDNDGRLIIQGGSPGESQVYINDLIVANPYHLSSKNNAVRSRFSADLFDGVVLQTGGSNAEFGQALSGVVNLNTKDKDQLESKTDLSLSSVFAGVTHMQKKSSLAYRASLNYTNLEPYGRLFPDAYQWEKYYNEWFGDVFLVNEFSPRTKLMAQVNLSHADGTYRYENVDSVSFHNALKSNYAYAQANLFHTINSHWSLSLASNVIYDQFSGTDVQYQTDEVETANVWNHNKFNVQYQQGKIVNRSGVEFIHNPYDEVYRFYGDHTTSIQNNLLGVYNDTKLFLSENFTASLGLRGEYSLWLKAYNVAPRVYLAYKLKPDHVVSFSLGEYHQLPAMDNLKLSSDLGFTTATKSIFSYSYVKKSSKLQVDTYYKKYKNLVCYTPGLYLPENLDNSGHGEAFGADIFLKHHYKALEYWFTYSYNHTRKQDAYFHKKIQPFYVSEQAFNITLKYWVGPLKSLLGANYNISSGTPYYDKKNPYDCLGTTPLRNRLDLSWSFLPKPWIVINFGCQNVWGYKNIYGYEYSNIHNGLRKEIANPDKRFFFLGIFVTLSQSKELNQLKNL